MYTYRVLPAVVAVAGLSWTVLSRLFGSTRRNTSGPEESRQPPFQMTTTEHKMWDEWAQTSAAADPQRALQDWASHYNVRLTNQNSMDVARTVTHGVLLPPVLDPEIPGEAVPTERCNDHCATSFATWSMWSICE
jgi:hypothetical protein